MPQKELKAQEETTKVEELPIFFPDELKKGVFSNNIFINHTSEEFVLDFLTIAPTSGSVVARVILTPSHTKRLINALSDNLKKYEEKYGKIPEKIQKKA